MNNNIKKNIKKKYFKEIIFFNFIILNFFSLTFISFFHLGLKIQVYLNISLFENNNAKKN